MSVIVVLWSLWHVGLDIVFQQFWLLCNVCKHFMMVSKVRLCVYELSQPCKYFSHPYTKSSALSNKCHHYHPKHYLKCHTYHILLLGSHTEVNSLFMCLDGLCFCVIKVC